MTCDAFPPMAEFHHLGTQAHVELLAHQRVGHGVGVAFDLHVVINVDPGKFPLGIRIGLHRLGPERWAVEGGTQLLAGASQRLKGAGIQRRQEGSKGGIDLHKREEGVVPEAGEHPALHNLDADLHLGLIAGFSCAGGDDGTTIMLGEGRIGAIDLGA